MVRFDKEKQFEWMKIRRKYHAVLSVFDVPIFIILWYLNYKTAFWILLCLVMIDKILHWNNLRQMAEIVGIKEV